MKRDINLSWDLGTKTAHLQGPLVAQTYMALNRLLNNIPPNMTSLDLSGVTVVDMSGAKAIFDAQAHHHFQIINVPQGAQKGLDLYKKLPYKTLPQRPSPKKMVNFFEKIGQEFLDKTAAATELINFLGLFLVHLLATLKAPLKPFFSSLCSHLYTSGLLAIPIIIVTSFVVGVVLCYEGVVQLAKFGAESSVVTLISYSVLREAGALITAIVLAGRSGSSFTAEIGAMKINEEIDAMKVMGIDPINALIVPRIISLIFILPALTFIADIFGLLGGALICHAEIHMSLGFYFEQIQNTVNPTTFLIGLVKAPFFGLTIGLIGCLQGFKVHGSASSVGRKTTLSVVQSIFCIILLNSLFSVTVSYFRIGS